MVSAVIFNLVVLGINWGVAEPDRNQVHQASDDIILSMLIAATVLINLFVVRALLTGRETRQKFLHGLVTMYKDNNVEEYYDDSLLSTYGFRDKLFVAVVLILAVIAIFVPLMMRIFTFSICCISNFEFP